MNGHFLFAYADVYRVTYATGRQKQREANQSRADTVIWYGIVGTTEC